MNAEENRSTKRTRITLPVMVGLLTNQADPLSVPGRIIDISPSGVRLRLEEEPPFTVNDRVYIEVEGEDAGNMIDLQGSVRWVRAETGYWESGIKLTGMAVSEWDPWLDLLSFVSETELPPPA